MLQETTTVLSATVQETTTAHSATAQETTTVLSATAQENTTALLEVHRARLTALSATQAEADLSAVTVEEAHPIMEADLSVDADKQI